MQRITTFFMGNSDEFFLSVNLAGVGNDVVIAAGYD